MSRAYRLLNIAFHAMAYLIFVPATVVIASACAIMIMAQISSYGKRYFVFVLIMCIVWLLICLTMIVIHELGHVLAAIILRWQIHHVCIGPLTLTRQGEKFKLKRSTKRIPNDGYVMASSSRQGRTVLLQFCFYSLGGVLANLCVALLSFALLFTQTGFSAALEHEDYLFQIKKLCVTNNWIVSTLMITFLVNLFYTSVNLIPKNWIPLASDGKLFIRYLVSWILGISPPADQNDLFVHELLAEKRSGLGGALFPGQRPKEWDTRKLASLQEPGQPSKTIALGKLCAFYFALDRGEIDLASTHLNAALELRDAVTGNDRSAIFLEAAYFQGFHRNDPVSARKWLHQVNTQELQEYTFLRGAAAVLLAEGLYNDALTSASAALEQAKRLIDSGAIEAEKEWLMAIIESCKKQLIQECIR